MKLLNLFVISFVQSDEWFVKRIECMNVRSKWLQIINKYSKFHLMCVKEVFVDI